MESRKREANQNVEDEDDSAQTKRRKTRFGQAPPPSSSMAASTNAADAAAAEAAAAAARAAAAKIAAAIPSSAMMGSASSTKATAYMSEKEKLQANAHRALQIKQSIQAQISNMSSLLAKAKGTTGEKMATFMPAPLLLDEQGRHVDASGKVIKDAVAPLATLKANQLAAKGGENPYLAHRTVSKEDQMESLDPRLKLKKRETRGAKSFTFVKEGTFIKQAEQMRNRQAKKMMAGFTSGRNPQTRHKEGIVAMEEKEGDDAPALVSQEPVSVEVAPLPTDPIPLVEWWDIAYLTKQEKEWLDKSGFQKLRAVAANSVPDIVEVSYDVMTLTNCDTAHVIEHPARIKLASKEKDEKPIEIPLMLTAAERKKLRRQNRADREKEKQDKLALGLIPPPEPKVKLSNMMRVLQEQAVADPSAVEKKVREQVAQRLLNHEMRNLARKLTPEERREKTRNKLKEDAAGDIHVAVFCILDLSNPKNRFKVDVNAQQSYLTGGVLICKEEDINVVVVEGGVKSVKKYIKLMTRRINWCGDKDNEDDSDDDEAIDLDESDLSSVLATKKCVLVWKGVVSRRSFNNFRFQECRTAATARKVLEAKRVVHYWDAAYKIYQASRASASSSSSSTQLTQS